MLCLDDPSVRAILPRVSRPVRHLRIRSGEPTCARYRVRRDGLRTRFEVVRAGSRRRLPVVLAVPGLHNVLNALAAIAVATELGVR